MRVNFKNNLLKTMTIKKCKLKGLKNKIIGGKKILSKTISVNTVESEIARSLENIQNEFKNIEIGSYPFFKEGKLGVSIVIRSEDQSKIDDCNLQILKFISEKNIEQI